VFLDDLTMISFKALFAAGSLLLASSALAQSERWPCAIRHGGFPRSAVLRNDDGCLRARQLKYIPLRVAPDRIQP
jgi:hypothetical protein